MNRVTTAFALALPDGGSGTEIPGVAPHANVLAGYAVWGVLALCVIGFIIGCGKLAIAHNRREPADMSSLGITLVAAIGALSATGIITGVIG